MSDFVIKAIIICVVILNLNAFAFYGIDKRKAIKNIWRIPEKTLHLVGFLGGIGALLGMQLFRHKTKHMSFMILVPIYALLNGVFIGYLIHCIVA